KSAKNPKNLTGIPLIEYKCRKKKRAWGTCVKEHYEQKFLPGKSLDAEDADCDDLFDNYRECYMKGLLSLRKEQGKDLPKEGTLLHEFMEEEGIQFDSSKSKSKSGSKDNANR
ncbi:MAG: hypothetical protein SGARI_001821, partial [Bacillariaceae sp.]